MSIESNVFDRVISNRKVNESSNMQFSDSVASDIASALPAYSFTLAGILTNLADFNMPITIDVRLNSDDIEAVESDNVVYVYLNTDKIDYSIKADENSKFAFYYIRNLDRVLKSKKVFIKKDKKCWKDDSKLYLLKMNRNTGIISRFNINTGTFNQQKDNLNYQSATNTDIAKNLLTVDYLTEYLSSQLIFLKPMIDPMEDRDIDNKNNQEAIKRIEYRG